MQRTTFTILAFILLSYSCKNELSHTSINKTKDSIIKRYLSVVDTLPYYDTSVTEFKLLKAYTLNDTNTLSELSKEFEKANKKYDYQIYSDSCVKQPDFKDIMAEEKYRFLYTEAFCPYATSMTVVRYKDSTVLKTIVYCRAWDTASCKILEQTTVLLDSAKWMKFEKSMEIADFWGLKSNNGKSGCDGSTLKVAGFKKGMETKWNPDRWSSVYRWSPANQSIMKSFVTLLDYSETQIGCPPFGLPPELIELNRS